MKMLNLKLINLFLMFKLLTPQFKSVPALQLQKHTNMKIVSCLYRAASGIILFMVGLVTLIGVK